MKHSKAAVRGEARPVLDIRFEPQHLTSHSGLILFQHFFSLIRIKERLWSCFRHLKVSPIYGHHVVMMLLVVHLILGHRRLRDVEYYRDDAMVKRVLGLKRLRDVSTLSRSLASADEFSVEKVRRESRNLVQVLDVYHRSGNVHDSKGTDAFIGHCLHSVRAVLPGIKVETRIDRESNSPFRFPSSVSLNSKGSLRAGSDGVD